MNYKRIDVCKEDESYWGFYYFCPFCGSEIIGGISYFAELLNPNNKISPEYRLKDAICPNCGEDIIHDRTHFLDISMHRLYSNTGGALQARNFGFWYNKEDKYPEVNVLPNDFVYQRDKSGEWDSLFPASKNDNYKEDRIKKAFDFLRYVRQKDAKAEIEGKIDNLLSESEAQPYDAQLANIVSVKSNPEQLVTYIEQLINIESSIYAVKQRLNNLYISLIQADEDFIIAQNNVGEKERKALQAAEARMANLPTIKSFASQRPKAPSAPDKPTLKQAGLFNKKKIQEENEKAQRDYEKKKEKYDIDLIAYNKTLSEFEQEVQRRIKTETQAAKEQLNKAKFNLDRAISNPPSSPQGEIHKLVVTEIQEAETTLKKLIKGKNELYSLNIVFEKYRNLVALSSFYEYLITGRCNSLEGANGAYNLYETEIRANQIISQLSDVLASLEQIKNNQFTAFSKLQAINSDLTKLNSSMTKAVNAIDRMQTDVSSISHMSEVIAYNTEQAAYYGKKNNELVHALGFLVALK